LPQGVIDFITSAPKDADPMDVVRTGVSMLGLYDHRGQDGNRALNEERSLSIIAKIPLIIGYYHRARQGPRFAPFRTDLSEAGHFLYLITGEEPTAHATKTLDIAYIIHAEHGMNASTFSARVTIATLSDIYSAITSAIGTLKGPLHGGANEGVIHMLEEIGSPEKVDAWVEERLAKKEKIMGIGHRVYKVLDPRAPHLRRMAIKLTEELGEPKWIQMSERIAEIMRTRKHLEANVDFYSATVYHSLGIPTDLFTPIFAISRAARLDRPGPGAARRQPSLSSTDSLHWLSTTSRSRRSTNGVTERPLPLRGWFPGHTETPYLIPCGGDSELVSNLLLG